MNKDKTEGKGLDVLMIYLAVCLGISMMIGWTWELPGLESIKLGFIAGTFLLLLLLPHFVIWVNGNEGVVLQNYLLGKSVVVSDAKQKNVASIAIPRGQRAVMAGIRLKLPQERPLGMPINFKRDEIASTTVTVYDRNRSKYYIKWQAPLTPVPGKYLPRFLLVSDKVAKAFFEGYFQNQLISKFRALDGLEAIENLNRPTTGLNIWFSNLLGGPNVISDEEREQGRFTGTPTITEIIPDEEDKKLAQAKNAATKDAEAVEALTKHGVSANNALAAVLLSQGKAVDMISITGLEGSGDGENRHLLAELINRNKDNKNKKGKK